MKIIKNKKQSKTKQDIKLRSPPDKNVMIDETIILSYLSTQISIFINCQTPHDVRAS